MRTPYRLAVVDYEDERGHAAPMSPAECAERPFFVLAFDAADNEVAHGEFYHHGPDELLMCNDVFVDPAHRRRGLATQLYQAAERAAGKTLHPYPAQNPDGRALWLNPSRPFGRGVPNPTEPVLDPPTYSRS